jgi:phage repressor protein C with HTH and peptisase S24 domain
MIANRQEQFCNGIANGIFANSFGMDGNENDRALIQALSDWARKSPSEVARGAGLAVSTLTRPLNHDVKHTLSNATLKKLRATYPEFPGWRGEEPDQPEGELAIAYASVEVLPTYAGMGGGGTGDGDVETALVPLYLIENVFRGQPSDFVLIRVRGNSMEPVFRHDDELLVDKRDRSPTQSGPFAIWDAEWGEYLVKNVERMPGGRVRLFPSNAEYSATEVKHEETKILGRPVWFGRRL